MSNSRTQGAADPGQLLQELSVWCCEVEVSGDGLPTAVVPRRPNQLTARVLVRLHGEPMGYVQLPVTPTGVDHVLMWNRVWQELSDRINDHLSAEGLSPLLRLNPGARPGRSTDACPTRIAAEAMVSVVVCTRNRPEILSHCLSRLRSLTYPHLEVIVVDNAPTDDRTRLLVEDIAGIDGRFRYATEPRPGLSCARNRGLVESKGKYVAYTDDDVSVDPHWVEGLVRGFQRGTEVGCVTGLVCTASISSSAEAYFDARASSWSSRTEAEVFDLEDEARPEALYPYSPGVFGTGANLAVDRDLLCRLEGFDESLGAGTMTRGGEDLDIFLRVLRAGRAIVYEPSALVWHHHRVDRAALLKQMFGYGTGLSAFLTKYLVDPSTRWDVLRRVPAGGLRVAGIRSATAHRLPVGMATPKGALRRELAGFAAGPLLYARALRRAH